MKDKKKTVRKTSIGGQALLEGIMMRGPQKTAMAVRNPAGEIVLEEVPQKPAKKGGVKKIPVLRGVVSFVESMVTGYKCLTRSAEIAMPEEEDEKKYEGLSEEEIAAKKAKEKKKDNAILSGAVVIATVIGTVLAVALFVMLPSYLYKWLCMIPALHVLDPALYFEETKKNMVLSSLWKSLFEGILKIAVLVAYMACVSLMKDIRRTFQYHGAEHKTIFCYEHDRELTVDNVMSERRFHPRCGTSFLILMLLVGIFIAMLIDPLFYLLFDVIPPTYVRALIKLCLVPVIMGLGYELIRLAGKHDNVFTRILSAPGMWLQHITVLEPTPDMVECAVLAFRQVAPDGGKCSAELEREALTADGEQPKSDESAPVTDAPEEKN